MREYTVENTSAMLGSYLTHDERIEPVYNFRDCMGLYDGLNVPNDIHNFYITIFIGDNDYLNYLDNIRDYYLQSVEMPLEIVNDMLYVDIENHTVSFNLYDFIPMHDEVAIHLYLEDMGFFGDRVTYVNDFAISEFLGSSFYKAMNTFRLRTVKFI